MLTDADIIRIVNGYIGVEGGYLGTFSYRTHAEFYPEYCDLDIDPDKLEGTTRERFIQILKTQNPQDQAKILKGILEKYPLDSFKEKDKEKKKKHYDHIIKLIKGLEGVPQIEKPDLSITTEVVQRAIDDARTLIEKNGATSAVDRVHTVLHGYLKAICEKENISLQKENPNLNELFKEIKNHPKLRITCERKDDIKKIINAMANIIDALNSIRNRASIAHPNKELLDEDEAILVINSTQTLLHYINSKFKY